MPPTPARRPPARPAPTPPAGSGSRARAPDLRWSLFTVADNVPGAERRTDRYAEILAYVEEAERLGYWAFFFAEHHFDPHGVVPDPWLLVAAASERTRSGRIRLGPMVSNLAFRNPVRLAEQTLLANRLCGDRVEIGVGSGNVLQEHVAFGLYPDPVSRKREAFDGAVPAFLSAVEGGSVSAPHHPAGSVRIPIEPIRPLGARVWVAAGRTEVAVRFASQGHSIALGPPFATMPELAALATQVSQIHAALDGRPLPRIAAAFPTYVGPEPGPALDALDRFLAQKRSDGTAHLPPRERSASVEVTAADLVRRDLAVIGTPSTVRRQLKAIAATGISDVFAIPDFGGLRPELVTPSLAELAQLAGVPASAGAGLRVAAAVARGR